MAESLFYFDPNYKSKLLEEFGFKEQEDEILVNQWGKTGFPDPIKTYHLMWEVYDLSLEEPYFWILDDMKTKYPILEKLEDSFAAAENSAFFGVTQQRLGAQQDKVSQFLATVGKMIKELFQMVRELRIIDERLTYYGEVKAQLDKDLKSRGKSAEITLKGMFIDLVQGGGKSAASVYGMARELEFITLPDLFFDAPPFRNADELEAHVKSLEEDFNTNVLRVLQRHIRQYMEWKKRTHQEHRNRRGFMLQYLLQHFEIVQMYINWIKPYLRNVAKLTMKSKNMSSPDIVSAFEGSMLDVEILGRKRVEVGESGANGCCLATFRYRTRPELKVVQEGYQRGPVHIGKFEFFLRVYKWKDEEVEQYKRLKEKESLILMGEVSSSVQKAMEALGEKLNEYLAEARGQKEGKPVEEKDEKPKKSVMERMLGDFYNPNKKKKSSKKVAVAATAKMNSELKGLGDYTKAMTWLTYKNFKKAHRMIQW